MLKTLCGTALVVVFATTLGRIGGLSAETKRADLASVVNSNTKFAFDLFGKLKEKEGNLFFSPTSITTALAMTYGGASGDTASEMAKALHFTLPPERLHSTFAALLQELKGDSRKQRDELVIANGLWGQKGVGFKEDFLRLTREDYGAAVRDLDFAGDSEAARRTINAWVEEQSRNKIKDLLKRGVLGENTRLVLTNAVYFKGGWSSPFDKGQTRDAEFLGGPGKVTVSLMHQTGSFNYFDAGGMQVLELPYASKQMSMVVLLPKKVDGLAEQEKSLTADKLAGWLDKVRPQKIAVFLPSFQATSVFDLKGPLIALGMRRAFTPAADFSNLSDEHDLYISAAVHQAFVDVNEAGTEAAAASGVVVEKRVLLPTPVFRADHPFIYLIRETRNNSILFLGRLVRPTK